MTEELDEVRGVLAALANRGNGLLQPVSTNAVTAALKWRNRSFDSGQCLDRLGKVGDVQRLPGGLWLPCSTKLFRCAGLMVAVSGLPTTRLATELGENPQKAGDCRVFAGSAITESDIRLRDFGMWCTAPESSLLWSAALIADARYWQGTLTEGMEWHDHWTPGRRSRWSELHVDVDLERGPVLARLRSRHGAAEHFLLRRNGGALQMAEVSKVEAEHHRLRYALLAAAGNPANFRIARQADGFTEVAVPRILPGPEAMVLGALGRVLTNPEEWEQVYSLPESAWPQVERILMGLGLVRSDAA
ncbi:MAG: hypothetical protein M3Y79_07370 [Pseudomonadota bacterium]|nr:hypothetical protein [Pseudomonadota bacterium]